MEVIPGSVRSNGNGAGVGKGGKLGTGARGRKGADKQEQVIEPKHLKERLEHLVRLKKAHDEAGKDLNDAIKAVAKKSGFLSSVVRKVVVAKAGEGFEDAMRAAEQLELAFEEASK